MKKRWLCLVFVILNLCGCTTLQNEPRSIYQGEVLAVAGIKEGDSLKLGYIDPQGQWIIEPRFDEAEPFSQGLAAVKENGKWGYILTDGTYQIQPQFDRAFSFQNDRAPVYQSRGGKVKEYFIDPQGQKVFEIKLGDEDWYGDFVEDRLLVCKNGKFGYLDPEGKEAIPCMYDNAFDFSNGLAAVRKGKKVGYIDVNGEEVIPIQYQMVSSYKNDRIIAYESIYGAEGDHCVVFDGTGQLIFEFDGRIQEFEEEVSQFMTSRYVNGKEEMWYGYISKNGEMIVEPFDGDAEPIDQGRGLIIKDKEDMIIIDLKGNPICSLEEIKSQLPKKYDNYFWEYSGNYVEESRGYFCLLLETDTGREDEYGWPIYDCEIAVVDLQGELVVDPVVMKEESITTYHPDSGLILQHMPDAYDYFSPDVPTKICYRYIRPDGTEKEITVDSDYPMDYHHSLWAVEQDGKWGYVDPRGEWAIEPQFDWAGAFLAVE